MGKKRIIKKSGSEGEGQKRSSARTTKRKIDHGVLHINASYNNTTINLADREGKVVA